MLITAERVLVDDLPRAGVGVRVAGDGRIAEVGALLEMGPPDVELRGKLLVPGLVNAHSHAFQRLLRGRTQLAGPTHDSFWTWRDAMYVVASRLDPDSMYVVARHAFLEMLLAGVTTVGEFHYVHHRPDGAPYDDPSELALAVTRAANDAGVRLCLIRAVYLRGDFDAPLSPLQARFCDGAVDEAMERITALDERLATAGGSRVSLAVAAHSVRAVPIGSLAALKSWWGGQSFHIHVSEQRREVEGCMKAHGMSPVALLAENGVLDGATTLVHATHLTDGDAELIARHGSTVCVCPSTEADLGDGLGPIAELYGRGVPFALGTDGQTLSSVLAEARRLEMHERLRLERRNVLAREPGNSTASAVFTAATRGGARSLGLMAGRVEPGAHADFATYDLDDPALAGCDDASLLAALVFSSDSRAVRDVMVGGRFAVRDGEHAQAEASVRALSALGRQLFA